MEEDSGSGGTRIAYLGPAGTFSEEALLSQPDLASLDLAPFAGLSEVLEAVNGGKADLGFVPIENSIEGAVTATMDSLIFDVDLLIQKEVVLDIHLNLVGLPGTQLDDVKTLLSLPVATAQCRGFVTSNLPNVDIIPVSSTAEAARLIGEERRANTAALAPKVAADLYDLQIIKAAVEDHHDNQTRFVLISPSGIPAPSGHDKTSIVCFQRDDHPGSLHTLLSEFAARGLNLTKIESRPTKRGLGDYCFLIDLEGHIANEVVADCLKVLKVDLAGIKFLGSYPAAGVAGQTAGTELDET